MKRAAAERKARRAYGPGAFAQCERRKWCVIVVPGLAAGYGATYQEAWAELVANVAAVDGERLSKYNA